MAHLIGHVNGVIIERSEDLQAIMTRVADVCKFHVVAQAFHQFQPVGTTGVFVLAESHFSAHTYPENKMVYIDVFCCAKDFDPDACSVVIEREFGSTSGTWQIIQRPVNDQHELHLTPSQTVP